MTETNLNLVLTNALKCSSELAVQVADLYASGNKCADSEFAKLKLLIDRIEALTSYGFDETVVTTTIAKNCLKEKEADDMMHKIMHECNICDCQLIN